MCSAAFQLAPPRTTNSSCSPPDYHESAASFPPSTVPRRSLQKDELPHRIPKQDQETLQSPGPIATRLLPSLDRAPAARLHVGETGSSAPAPTQSIPKHR